MRERKRIDTGCINLFGKLAQSGEWLCINSAGDSTARRHVPSC